MKNLYFFLQFLILKIGEGPPYEHVWIWVLGGLSRARYPRGPSKKKLEGWGQVQERYKHFSKR